MKCTACGCEKLYKVEIINNQVLATEGYVEQTVDSYACEKCGHVELYVDKNRKKEKSHVWTPRG